MNVDAHLDRVTKAQLETKPGACRKAAVAIVRSFVHDRIQWSDNIRLGLAKSDCNVIGPIWRRLVRLGILKRMEGADAYKRSAARSRKGGMVWKYRLANEDLAAQFLSANQDQQELKLDTPKTTHH